MVLGGALGVGIGLGLQNVVSNFVAGLILLIEQPIRIGDRIETKDTLGDVVRIAARSTWIRTNDNVVIIVPNNEFINNSVTNWTANDPTVRVPLPVGVGYKSNPEQVRALLLQAAAAHPDVLADPSPDVIFTDYGDNSLNFTLRVDLDPDPRPNDLEVGPLFRGFQTFQRTRDRIAIPAARSSSPILGHSPAVSPRQ